MQSSSSHNQSMTAHPVLGRREIYFFCETSQTGCCESKLFCSRGGLTTTKSPSCATCRSSIVASSSHPAQTTTNDRTLSSYALSCQGGGRGQRRWEGGKRGERKPEGKNAAGGVRKRRRRERVGVGRGGGRRSVSSLARRNHHTQLTT